MATRSAADESSGNTGVHTHVRLLHILEDGLFEIEDTMRPGGTAQKMLRALEDEIPPEM
jgi:hypothetical protein